PGFRPNFSDSSYRRIAHSNNRLLELEQELLEQHHQPKKQKPKSKRSRIKSQVFDTGEAITLQYNSKVYPIPAPKTTIISTSEPELIVTPPQVFSNPEILEDISPEVNEVKSQNSTHPTGAGGEVTSSFSNEDLCLAPKTFRVEKPGFRTNNLDKNSLSQAAESISEIEPKFNDIQAEDLPPILPEFNPEREEKPATLIPPKEQSVNDQNNPHAIFDRMGKNMAYATTFDVGTIELEQLFDEFDSTLDQEEQVNQSHSFSQRQDNLELEQRFDEFDRALELEEQLNNGDSIAKIDSPSEILLEKANMETEEPEDIDREETEEITSKLGTKAIQNQNQSSMITPLEIQQPELVQPLNPANELDTQNLPEFDLKLEAVLLRSGLNLISLIVWLINLLCRTQIKFNPEIKLKSTSSPISDDNQENNPEKTPNDQIIDISQSDLNNVISPLILSSQQSVFLATATPMEFLTPNRDPLTGMLYDELTQQNSYSLTDSLNSIAAKEKITNRSNLDIKPYYFP
ncbi:MAG TPA: hypothetical protein DCF68_18655, partial [Cyanothece sp. UBA12306]|nr:hypothetical protein [Cyanothece sp. UBA12306]